MIHLGNGLYSDKNYLCHYGIPGQKWGVKHGPPYPLSYKVKRNAKIGKTQGMSKYISEADNQYEESYSYVSSNGKTHFMTPEKALQIIEKEEPDYITIPGRNLGGNYSWDSSDFGINDMNQQGQSNNCAKCASTAMLRRMGYDVQPGRSAFGALTEAPEYWWNNAEKYNNLSMVDAYDILNGMPNGAAGTIAGQRDDGGHVLNWEKTESGVNFMDFQPKNGLTNTDIRSVFNNEHFNKDKDCTIYRLDTASPNWDHMAEDGVFRITKDDHSAIYGRQQDNFYKDISYSSVQDSENPSVLHNTTTFKDVFKEWEHGIVSKKNGEQSRGWNAI